MERIKKSYKDHFTDKSFVWSVVLSLFLLVISLIIEFYAGTYATEVASSPVKDLILSNIPVFDVDAIFIYGPLVLWLFVAGLLLYEPKKIPFVLKSIALFVVIRSVFITLTHIGPYPDQIVIAGKYISKFSFGGDLFFSAHTGLPFLMALVFWQNKFLRTIFIATAVFFGITVLLGHLHYSIDVLSAFFITYSIFRLAEIFFKKDKEFFDGTANIRTEPK
jgi:hypothetical protein